MERTIMIYDKGLKLPSKMNSIFLPAVLNMFVFFFCICVYAWKVFYNFFCTDPTALHFEIWQHKVYLFQAFMHFLHKMAYCNWRQGSFRKHWTQDCMHKQNIFKFSFNSFSLGYSLFLSSTSASAWAWNHDFWNQLS